MIQFQITVPQWLNLDQSIRARLITLFKIPRSEGTSVIQGSHGTQIMSDGHTNEDLAVLTLERMNEYLERESSDYFGTLNEVIEKVLLEEEDFKREELDKRQEDDLASLEKRRLDTLEAVAKLLNVSVLPEKKRAGRPPKAK